MYESLYVAIDIYINNGFFLHLLCFMLAVTSVNVKHILTIFHL